MVLILLVQPKLARPSGYDRDQRLEFCKLPEVLGGGGERKFVLDATWASQSEPTQAKDAFEVGEEHLDLFAPLLRRRVERGCCALVCKLPDLLKPLAGDGTRIHLGTPLRFRGTNAADHLAGAVFAASRPGLLIARVFVVLPGALELFAFGAKIPVIIGIPGEVGS